MGTKHSNNFDSYKFICTRGFSHQLQHFGLLGAKDELCETVLLSMDFGDTYFDSGDLIFKSVPWTKYMVYCFKDVPAGMVVFVSITDETMPPKPPEKGLLRKMAEGFYVGLASGIGKKLVDFLLPKSSSGGVLKGATSNILAGLSEYRTSRLVIETSHVHLHVENNFHRYIEIPLISDDKTNLKHDPRFVLNEYFPIFSIDSEIISDSNISIS